MTGTISCCSAMPPPLATSGGGAVLDQPVAGTSPDVTGGGLAPTAPIAPTAPTTPTTAPSGDLVTVLGNLSQAVGALAALLQAQAGAGNVTGGGPTTTPAGGCSCGTGASTEALTGATNVAAGGAAPLAATTQAYANVSVTGGGGPAQSAPTTPAPPTQAPPTDATQQAPPLPAGGTVRDQIVTAARAELAKNVREDAGPDADSGGNIVRYRGAVTGPGEDPNVAEAWCADFASYIWKTAGVPFGKDGQGEDFTPFLVDYAKSTGSWKTADPQPGDMVLLDWEGGRGTGNDRGLVDHVAIVDRVENGVVHTIGGNQGEAVSAGQYPLDSNLILGFVPPKGG